MLLSNSWDKLPLWAKKTIHRAIPRTVYEAARKRIRAAQTSVPERVHNVDFSPPAEPKVEVTAAPADAGPLVQDAPAAPLREVAAPVLQEPPQSLPAQLAQSVVDSIVSVTLPLSAPTWFTSQRYCAQFPDAPTDVDGAYEHFLSVGAAEGATPNKEFSLPEIFWSVPVEHRQKIAVSPVICRAPATLYLEQFRSKKELHSNYGTLSEYLRCAATRPNLIGARLWENDIRIAAYMDSNLRRMATEYRTRSQDELISIIMPTYNRPVEISDAILSVLSQSYENWELIIVDDASTDVGAAEVAASFNDSRIYFIRLPEQSGNGNARNVGLRKASGTVIAYLDDDDQWDPDNLLMLYWSMRDQKTRCAYGAQAVWIGFDERTGVGAEFKVIRFAPFNRALLENDNYISMISFIHDRDVLDEVGMLDESLSRYLDWDLFLRITEVATPLAVPAILSHYFQRRAAVSISAPTDKTEPLRALRERMHSRSDLSFTYVSKDGTSHVGYSLGRKSLAMRKARYNFNRSRVRILIPNYEAPTALAECLASIAAYTPADYDVVVIDNNSSEASLAQINETVWRYENVRLISEETPGFSYAVNRGLAEPRSSNDFVLILNNDTIVTPAWLDELLLVLEDYPEAVAAIPRQVLPADSKTIRAHVPGATTKYECDTNLSAHHDSVLDPFFAPAEALYELSYAPLFCALIRGSALQKVPRLDARNGAHFRTDWIFFDELRRLTGGKIIYTPHSKIYHMQGVSTMQSIFG